MSDCYREPCHIYQSFPTQNLPICGIQHNSILPNKEIQYGPILTVFMWVHACTCEFKDEKFKIK